jgi:hypothetical protein
MIIHLGRFLSILLVTFGVVVQRVDAAPLRSTLSTCGSWQLVSSPLPRHAIGALTGLASVSKNDVWAVGDREEQNSSGQGHPLIEHWNGTRWTIVSGPSAGLYGLSEIAAVSRNDVWAVGSAGKYPYTSIEHWNGVRWSLSPAPKIFENHGNAVLVGVAALSSTDVWAVGAAATSTLTEHWNGRRWIAVPRPNPAPPTGRLLPGPLLSAAAGTSSSDVWAVGRYGGLPERPLLERWNGGRWTVITTAGLGHSGGWLSSISALSSHDIWAVGGTEGNSSHILIGHWNGTKWSLPSPLAAAATQSRASLFSVAALGPRNVWAVGSTVPDAVGTRPIIVHWNGTRWRYGGSPATGSSQAQLWAIAGSGNSLWAVRINGAKGRQTPLIEHRTGC